MISQKTLVPNYYTQFECIADSCKHNCCIGWDIEIDQDTLEYYNTLGGKIGDDIRRNVSKDGCFILRDDGSCPFLEEDGLCTIIKELGGLSLCNICTDHPRFRNFYTDFCELGLGMCCEEAARIILGFKEIFEIPVSGDIKLTPGEKAFFSVRDKIFSILQNRKLSILSRMESLAGEFGFEFSDFSLKDMCSFYLSLERLDEKWTDLLNKLSDFKFDSSFFLNDDFSVAFEQLACYFVFRHFGRVEGDYFAPVFFALAGCYLVGALCSMHLSNCGSLTLDDISDYARMYSAEIEYSEENTDALFEYSDNA